MSYYFNSHTYPLWIFLMLALLVGLFFVNYALHHKRKMKKYLNYLGITGVYTSGLGLITHSVIPKLKSLLALHHTPYTTAFIAVFVISIGFLYLRKKRHRRQATQLVFKYLGVSGIASSGILLTLQELLKIGQ